MHFFLEESALASASLGASQFGPVDTNNFRISLDISFSGDVKVFSPEAGSLIVQKQANSTNLVNLLVCPSSSTSGPFAVEYYVFRGVKMDELIDGTGQVPNPSNLPSPPGLINKINNTSGNYPASENLAYGPPASLPDSTRVLDILNGNISGYNACDVEEGEHIGHFQSNASCSFEIILKNDILDLKIGFLRLSSYSIDVTNKSGFAKSVAREELLAFIDPAAFYGALKTIEGSIEIIDSSGNLDTVPHTSLYSRIISKMPNSNKVYLDIRDEWGYSYNLYEAYGDSNSNDIQVYQSSGSTATDVPSIYGSIDWPIILMNPNQIHKNGSVNEFKFRLRLDHNDEPILYLNSKSITPGGNTVYPQKTASWGTVTRFFRQIKQSPPNDWTKRLSVKFPNNGTSLSIANYIRLHYYQRNAYLTLPPPATPRNSSILFNDHYYDMAFCSIDIPGLAEINSKVKKRESSSPIYVKEPSNTDGTGGFEVAMNTGAYWDNNRIFMYSKIAYENSKQISKKEYLPTDHIELNTQGTICELHDQNSFKTIVREYEIDSLGHKVKMPGVNYFKSDDEVVTIGNHKENFMILGLTITEFNLLKNNVQVSDYHNRFIFLEPVAGNPQTEPITPVADARRFYKYKLQLQGYLTDPLAPNTIEIQKVDILDGNGDPIYIYSRDNQFFSSDNFSQPEIITPGNNEVEFTIYPNGNIKINDNIDLALVHDIQRMHYYYENDGTRSKIGDLDLKMSFRKVTGVFYNSTIHGPVSNYNLNHIDYATIVANEGLPATGPGDCSGVNIHNSWENTNGDVLQDGYFKPKNQPCALYRRVYKKDGSLRSFMVHFDSSELTAPSSETISFTYSETLRLYARPDLAAAVIGALLEIGNLGLTSTGFSFENGACYPSTTHINGEAIDTQYKGVLAQDQQIVDAFIRFGFKTILRGRDSHWTAQLEGAGVRNGGSLHEGHLHSMNVKIKYP